MASPTGFEPDLRVTNETVYEWLRSHAPRPSRAMAMVEMSGGHIRPEAIYQHNRQVRQSSGGTAQDTGTESSLQR
jgi:hypothetical protein